MMWNHYDQMASELTPYVDRCIFSFVEMYKKLEVNMPELRPVSEQDKLTLAQGMGTTARNKETAPDVFA